MDILHTINPEFILKTFGVLGLFIVVFAESGLFFGFFLPGDSLLFTAGFLAPFLHIHILFVVIGVCLSAILGDTVGYWFGKKVGKSFFTKDDSLFFKKKHIIRAHEFFTTHGAKALILARFVPVVRTFTPIIAGMAEMKYRTFLHWNILGGVLWGAGVTSAGYFLGRTIPQSQEYLGYIVIAIVLVSFIPVVIEVWKGYKK
jgi:membrane-associated protein